VRAITFGQTGEPDNVLTTSMLDDPEPGPGEVLVRVLLAPVHLSDLHVIRGRFGRQPELPASPGMECVGVVEELGPGVTRPVLGTRVVLANVAGTWRERLVSPVDRVIPVPDGVSDEDAAQALVNPVTALALTTIEHQLTPGEWLAQTAAGSTIGRLVLQLAHSRGFRTINLVRRTAQVPEIEELGGDVVISTEGENWATHVVEASGGVGPGKAIDCVAGQVGATLAGALAAGGRMLVFGALSSHRRRERSAFEMPVFAPRMIYRAATLQGWFLFHWFESQPLADSVSVLANALDLLRTRVLQLPPGVRFAPGELSRAVAFAETSGVTGKALLDFS
jgi:NADPH:quinone reductase-like Zn-dependent oxidoreductase